MEKQIYRLLAELEQDKKLLEFFRTNLQEYINPLDGNIDIWTFISDIDNNSINLEEILELLTKI